MIPLKAGFASALGLRRTGLANKFKYIRIFLYDVIDDIDSLPDIEVDMTSSANQPQEQSALYQKRIPIHTRTVKGKFRNFKTAVLVLAYAVYFLLPWLPWERESGAQQAILFDLVSRRFFIFDLVVYPQDIFALALLLVIAATLLFFATGLIGRAWCGYFCFQTLWTDAFMFIERFFQGERPARLRLVEQPWNLEKIAKVGGARALMLLLSFWTAFTFVAYFNHTPDFLWRFFSGDMIFTAYFSVLMLTITTFLAAALAREQVCIYMCPYARFQSGMYEPDTLVPSYDFQRGEGAAGRIPVKAGLRTREERKNQGHGDCIDCGYCVQVCPTGIDIRDGLQYQCITCGLCIDACNNIMDTLGWPRGLIRYDSERNLKSAQPGKPKLNFIRFKVMGYLVALTVMTGMLVYILATRTDFEVRVQQVRQPLYTMLRDGSISNRYEIHLVNKTLKEQQYLLRVANIPQEALDLGSINTPVRVAAGKNLRVLVKIKLNAERARRTSAFDFIIEPQEAPHQRVVRHASFVAGN